jgi:hypothetical protein
LFHNDFNGVLQECQTGEPIKLQDGRRIGYLFYGCFYKIVKISKHFLRTPPAIAIDEEVFSKTIVYRCNTIVILEREAEEIYEVPVSVFSEHCFGINRGYGTQLALPLKWWATNGNGVHQLSFAEVGAW